MSDKKRLTELLDSFGLKYSETSNDQVIVVTLTKGDDSEQDDKIQGYGGFYTEFIFNADESFLNMAIWE